jgi:hypothetical protein
MVFSENRYKLSRIIMRCETKKPASKAGFFAVSAGRRRSAWPSREPD